MLPLGFRGEGRFHTPIKMGKMWDAPIAVQVIASFKRKELDIVPGVLEPVLFPSSISKLKYRNTGCSHWGFGGEGGGCII